MEIGIRMKKVFGIGLLLIGLSGCATYVEKALSSRPGSGVSYGGIETYVAEAGGSIRQFCMPFLDGCTDYIYAPANLDDQPYEQKFEVVANDITLNYDFTLNREQVPEARRGTLILLHGYGGSKESLLLLANYFRYLGFHVIIPDLKGHGGSTQDEPGFGVDDVDVIQALIESMPARERPHPLYIAGYSMGAIAAIHTARQRDDISGVLLFGPMREFEDAAVAVSKMSYRRLSKIVGEEPVREGVRNTLSKRGIDAKELDVHHLLSTFKTPTLMIASDRDPIAPYDYFQPLQQGNVTVKKLPDRHHFLLTIPDENLHDLVYPWLEQHH